MIKLVTDPSPDRGSEAYETSENLYNSIKQTPTHSTTASSKVFTTHLCFSV